MKTDKRIAANAHPFIRWYPLLRWSSHPFRKDATERSFYAVSDVKPEADRGPQ